MDKQILKYFSDELSQEEKHQFLLNVYKDESLKEEFIYFQNIYSASQLSSRPEDTIEGKKSYEMFLSSLKRKSLVRQIRQVIKYAAIAAILIISTVFTTLYLNNQSSEKSLNTLYVPAGQRAKVTLQDGTEVWLNAQSTLTYPSKFSGKSRRVEVEGEAYFDVAEDIKRPFIVHTQHIDFEVLGTQFNIYSYNESNYTEATLVEGSLKVQEKSNAQNSVILKPNEQLSFKDGKIAVAPISNTDHLLWREGIYSFENEKLIDILDKLELYYDIKIIVEDPEIFNVNYTGKFRQRDGIEEILRILQIIQPFDIERDRENNTITLTK